MTDERDYSTDLTFSQRYGYEPLPEPMRLGEISSDLRREIFNSFRQFFMDARVGDHFPFEQQRRIERTLGKFKKLPESKVSTNYRDVISTFEQIILGYEFNHVLDLIEITIGEFYMTSGTRRITAFYECLIQVRNLFERYSAPYYFDTSMRPYRFFPRASKEQGEATQKAMTTIQDAGIHEATTHLRQAAEHINAGQYADSIADSILAVEYVARVIDPKSSTLGRALKSLEKSGMLDREFKQALEELYRYSNAKPGIRHAKRDGDAAAVGLEEAVLMFGACASFAAYLTQKHRRSGGG